MQGGFSQRPKVQTFLSQPDIGSTPNLRKGTLHVSPWPMQGDPQDIVHISTNWVCLLLDIHMTTWHLIWNSYHLWHLGEIKFGPRAWGYTVSKVKRKSLAWEQRKQVCHLNLATSHRPSLLCGEPSSVSISSGVCTMYCISRSFPNSWRVGTHSIYSPCWSFLASLTWKIMGSSWKIKPNSRGHDAWWL